MADCNQDLRSAGKAYPRTCARCGLGPCGKTAASPQPPHTEAPAARDEREALTTCNCRWRGEELVQQCELHEAWHVAIHEWAERAKAAEALLAVRAPQTVSGAADPVGAQPAGEQTGPVSAVPTPQAAPAPVLASDEREALELLALEYERAGNPYIALALRTNGAGKNAHDYEVAIRAIAAALAARAPQAAAEGQCSCVYATAANTPSVRDGFEVGGYLKVECDACKAQAAPASQPTVQAEAMVSNFARACKYGTDEQRIEAGKALLDTLSAPPVDEPVAHTALKQIQQHLRTTSYHPVKDRIFEIVDRYFDGAPAAQGERG